MHHSSYRDPLDPLPKWVKRKPVPSEDQGSTWFWDHTGIKPPSNKTIQQTPSQLPPKTPTHAPVSSVVRNTFHAKIAKQAQRAQRVYLIFQTILQSLNQPCIPLRALRELSFADFA